MTNIENRKLGTLIGLAVGDALGGPYEFMTKDSFYVHDTYQKGGAFDLKKGEYTDDTSMALCLASSLIEKKGFDAEDQMEKYSKWYNEGFMSSRDHCFDIGGTTRSAILRFDVSKNPYTKFKGKKNAGNAPIMRLAPIPMMYAEKRIDLIELSRLSSYTTHNADMCADASMYFAQLIANAYTENDKSKLEDNINFDCLDKELVNRIKRAKKNRLYVLPTGFIYNTLEVALHGFFHFDNFIDGLMFVISGGGDAYKGDIDTINRSNLDTDTVAAIYGQIAGAFYGLEGIPDYYKENLMDYDKILSIGQKLITTKIED